MNQQNRSLTNNNNIIPENDNPVEYCFLNDYQTDFYVDANVMLGSVCATLSPCTENNAGKKPEIIVVDYPISYGGSVDLCEKYEKGILGGYFMPLYREELAPNYWHNYTGEKMFYDFQLELCFDQYSDVIQFGIKDNSLILKSIVEYCGDYLPDDIIEINSIDDLRTKITQDIESLGEALKAFERLKTYKGGYPYTIEEVVWAHELKHLSNYKTQIVDDVNKESDLLNYSNFDIACYRDISIDEIKEEMIENYNEKLLKFEHYLVLKQIEKWGSDNEKATPEQKELNEKNETENTHNKKEVQDVIQKYIDELRIIMAEIQFGVIIIEQ